jgi:hypothetical protein
MRPDVVHFSSTPQRYKLSVSHCDAIDCTCTIVTFSFKAVGDDIEPSVSQPVQQAQDQSAGDIPAAFEVNVDALTWLEHAPRHHRSAAETAMAREFLGDYPRSERQALKERLEKKQRIANRFLGYRISPRDMGMMMPWSELASESGSVMKGGRSVGFKFEHETMQYSVEDMYCPNPQCDCARAQLAFFNVLPGATPDDAARAVNSFDASVSLTTGKPQVDECMGATPEEAAGILAAWWEHDANLLETLKWRDKMTKEVGQRSLPAAGRRSGGLPVRPGASRWIDTDSPNADDFFALRPLKPVRVAVTPGRNDKCPCGSGKKYKKCCGS